jgi:acetyl-CoA C-acetyltransferase
VLEEVLDMSTDQTVILSAARTPIGSFGGTLAAVPAPRLGAVAVVEALQRSGVEREQVDEVILGCVLPAGLGQAPARQAALFAGLPEGVGCMTINKVCGSGLKAVMLASQAIQCGDARVVVAGGMENMSQAPYLLPQARTGYRLGHGQIIDSMLHDGLWDVYNDYSMGCAAELCSRELKISREQQDAYASESYHRALAAIEGGLFKDEIVPVEVPGRKGEKTVVAEDEEPRRVQFDKIASLKPAFEKSGTVTAANASSINDGAAALVVSSAAFARERGLKPMARIVAQAVAGKKPEWFTTAPVDAVQKLLAKTGLKAADVDLFEINEAFAVVSLACNRLLELDPEKVNVQGGAVALGHPIGASGARILTTLLYAMQKRRARRGIAAICIGGGEAAAVLVET